MSEVVQLSNTDLRYQRYLRDNQVVQCWQGTANILKCFVAVTGAIHLSEVLVILLYIITWPIYWFFSIAILDHAGSERHF